MFTLHLFLARFFGLTLHDCPASQKALPPRPPTICRTAWEGVFASQFGLSCEQLHYDESKEEWTGGYEYTTSSVVWRKCAQSGCLWCRFLARHFPTHLRAGPRERSIYSVNIRVGIEYTPGRSLGDTMSVIVNGRHRDGWSCNRFTLYTREGDPTAAWMPDRILIPNLGSPYALALAKTCIETCIRDHPECQAITSYPVGSAPLPTRLVDCSDPDYLRLIETTITARGTYIALSYVWGDPYPSYRTTLMNLASYKVRVDTTTLPQTILDAIHVTRAFGIGFLWIDGLCIVQDSEADKHRELGRMRDVYRNAFLTIDAGSAVKVSEGFLQERRLNPTPNAVLPFICPLGDELKTDVLTDQARIGTVFCITKGKAVAGLSRTTVSDVGDTLRDRPATSYTVLRGWCLQERLLSTRSLIFTTETLQLRCHVKTQNVGGAPHDGEEDVPRLPDAVFHPDRPVVRGSDEWNYIHKRWWNIVANYTSRELSDPSDKLVAISGLAEMFAPMLGPDYLAGLWRNTLLADLFWSYHSLYSLEPTVYRGPSWSWAYTDHSVSWHEIGKAGEPFAEIVRCTVTLQNQSLPFGSVTGASLILRSSLLPCKWDIGNPDTWEDLVPDFPLWFSPFSLKETFHFFSDVEVALLEETRVWFVPVTYDLDSTSLYLYGLVVCRADTDVWHRAGACGQGDVYRRVGLADLEISVVAKQDSMNRFEDSDVYSMLSRLLRVDIELV